MSFSSIFRPLSKNKPHPRISDEIIKRWEAEGASKDFIDAACKSQRVGRGCCPIRRKKRR